MYLQRGDCIQTGRQKHCRVLYLMASLGYVVDKEGQLTYHSLLNFPHMEDPSINEKKYSIFC